jgi:hypothetical protein
MYHRRRHVHARSTLGVERIAALCLLLGVSGCLKPEAVTQPNAEETWAVRGAPSIAERSAESVSRAPGRKLALLVGVGEYRSDTVKDLVGPPNDARNMKELLTRSYGFLPENVSVLLDADATTEGFRKAFREKLVQRATDKDTVVIFFAGHGSQVSDEDDEESDGKDETLLFHDAREGGINDMVDDEFNGLLKELHAVTRNVVVILDSCNSGSATRDVSVSSARARFMPPADPRTTAQEIGVLGRKERWEPASLPGFVVFTAASEGTSALEIDGRGIFTDALLAVLGRPAEGLTYAQLARQIPPLMLARSAQIAYFEGDLQRDVFGEDRPKHAAWEVKEVGEQLELVGLPFPGMGVGAELRIYPGNTPPVGLSNPAKGKATVVVTEGNGLRAKAKLKTVPGADPGIKEGDLALLVRPSDEASRITVRLRPQPEPQGLTKARMVALSKALAHPASDSSRSVRVVEKDADFEVTAATAGTVSVHGPENSIRNPSVRDIDLPAVLAGHARVEALRSLSGEGGGVLMDQETLQVRLVKKDVQPPCGKLREELWREVPANQDRAIPLCIRWHVAVTLSDDAPEPMLVGGVLLSSDGSMYGLPSDGKLVELAPGKTHVFIEKMFWGLPPLGMKDTVRIFATTRTNPVAWHLLTRPVAQRRAAVAQARGGPPDAVSTREVQSALFTGLEEYMLPGTRTVGQERNVLEASIWTVSSVTFWSEANARFDEPPTLVPDGARSAPVAREYSLPAFDPRPYFPDDKQSALYKVLEQADLLAQRKVEYGQHAWSKPTEEENLAAGIDCSRAIWFAFTKAGVPYTQAPGSQAQYVDTARMVDSSSPMAKHFDRCEPDKELRLGDVLVYRDNTQGDGHTVMVIDPLRRIAWGSHGWDGNAAAKLPIVPKNGVEYQLIKYKPDWKRWDRHTMNLVACWRHKQFAQTTAGARALGSDPCKDAVCSALMPAAAVSP